MAQPGLRLLSLDGGGTRGLSTLYILREVMGHVISGDGGDVRPCEYFDLMGGAGLSGLSALLFVRFCYTIGQAIEALSKLARRLDDVEDFRLKVLQGDVEDAQRWQKCAKRFTDPGGQLEALRQGLVQEFWQEIIESNITDGLERFPHMENGEFDFKSPSAAVEAGRSKAFVVSSESQGYGENGGFDNDRVYNVPILHRTYLCRHGKQDYTLYAVGLATVASPDIMKSGVIFPDLSATGGHTVHNPTRLILQESSTLWPGLPIRILMSVGATSFELNNGLLKSLSSSTVKACLRIHDENQQLAEDIKRFVVPYDKSLARAYFRYSPSVVTPYREFIRRKTILEEIQSWLESDRERTPFVRGANNLMKDDFPTVAEDQVALASLASLLHALVVAGYSTEAAVVADVISNFILYEAASGEDGSFRKLTIAAEAERIGSMIHLLHDAYEKGNDGVLDEDLRSEGAMLNSLMAFNDSPPGGLRPPRDLRTCSDFAAGAYYCLTTLRRSDPRDREEPRFRMLLRQLSSLVSLPPEITEQSIHRMERLLELAALAALCEAGTAQALRGFKGLSYNGSLVRHVHAVLQNTDIKGVSQSILGPIANMFAISIQMDNWSSFSDEAIVSLLEAAPTRVNDDWSIVNLAVGRCNMEKTMHGDTVRDPNLLSLCRKTLERYASVWPRKTSDVLRLSISNGFFGLLWKCLLGENLATASQIPLDENAHSRGILGNGGETALHQAATTGFPYVMKMIVEGLGMDYCKDLVNRRNNQGQTALHLACRHRAPKEIFRLLYILGADANEQCHLGYTPLHYCFPNQEALPHINEIVMNMIPEYSLPTITLLDKPKAYGIDGKVKDIDPRTQDFRTIINQLVCRRADMSIPDHEGLTPLHLAAKHGWGDSLDVFFVHDSAEAERLQRTCLRIRDNAGLTVLDRARKTGTQGELKGGESTIISEMQKRAMEIPPMPAEDLLKSVPLTRILPLRKPKPAVDDQNHETQPEPYDGHSTPAPIILSTPAGLQPAARFEAPQVYRDPEVAGHALPAQAPYRPQAQPYQPAARSTPASPPVSYHYGDSGTYQNTEPGWRATPNLTDSKPKSGFLKKFRKGK